MPLIPQGLKNSLNKLHEVTSDIYHRYVPIINDDTSISAFAEPILNNPSVMNEFIPALLNRIVYTQFEHKYFRNPLQVLEGDQIPLGDVGQEIYVNPAKGRRYNVNDFAGLLYKYEADVKVQYHQINMDLQYCVTVARHKLKQAFVSWQTLDDFIGELSNSLYNGAYIDEYRLTKALVSNAYRNNTVQLRQINAPNTEELAKEFVTQARTYYLNFQTPSTEFNAWSQIGGYGRPILTWTNPEDIVFLVRNDIRAYLDVNVLANAFNIDKTTLLGNILPVDNFDIYNDNGQKIFDGSNIIGFIGDKRWFRIKRQDMFLDEFYNANNRTWQYYLNLTKMYNNSYFANGIVFTTKIPEITITGLSFNETNVTMVDVGDKEELDIATIPVGANTPNISYSSSNEEVFTVTSDTTNSKHSILTATGQGTATLTATAGNVTATTTVTVQNPAPATEASTMSLKKSTKSKTE